MAEKRGLKMEQRIEVMKDDLDDYLSTRRRKYGIPDRNGNSAPKKSIMSTLFGGRKVKVELEKQEELTVQVDPATGKALPKPVSAEIPEEREEEKEIKPKKKGIIGSFLSKIGVSKEDVDQEFIDEYEDEVDSLDKDLTETREDIKAVAKFATEIMAKLSPKQVDAIKETQEFAKFREVLKRYELIK